MRAHTLDAFSFDGTTLARAAASIANAGLLVVGEPHGVHETPDVVYTLASALDARAVAFEWSHEEMEEPVQTFLRCGSFDFERLWSLPSSAEFFCGDGRITAGHFALLQQLRDEGRLDQVVVFDRLDPEPPVDWQVRDQEMAERLLAEWNPRRSLIALTGGFHAQLVAAEGETMTTHLARERHGLAPAMIDYGAGQSWSRGRVHDMSEWTPPDAPIPLHVSRATPAVVPGRPEMERSGALP